MSTKLSEILRKKNHNGHSLPKEKRGPTTSSSSSSSSLLLLLLLLLLLMWLSMMLRFFFWGRRKSRRWCSLSTLMAPPRRWSMAAASSVSFFFCFCFFLFVFPVFFCLVLGSTPTSTSTPTPTPHSRPRWAMNCAYWTKRNKEKKGKWNENNFFFKTKNRASINGRPLSSGWGKRKRKKKNNQTFPRKTRMWSGWDFSVLKWQRKGIRNCQLSIIKL